MSYCEKCGDYIPEDASFCGNCGVRLPAMPVQAAPQYFEQHDFDHAPPPAPPYPHQHQYGGFHPHWQTPHMHFPHRPRRRLVGAGCTTLIIICSVMVIISPFLLFYVSGYGESALIGLQDGDLGEYSYGWLMLVVGILALVFSILAFTLQNKGLAFTTLMFGLIAFILPVILAAHMAGDPTFYFGDNILEIFYSSGTSGSYMSLDFVSVFLGGFICLFCGFFIALGGLLLIRKMNRAHHAAPKARPYY